MFLRSKKRTRGYDKKRVDVQELVGDTCSNSLIIQDVIKDSDGDTDNSFLEIKRIIEKSISEHIDPSSNDEQKIAKIGIGLLVKSITKKLENIKNNGNGDNKTIQNRIDWFSGNKCQEIALSKIFGNNNFKSYTDFCRQLFNTHEFDTKESTFRIKYRGKESGTEKLTAVEQCNLVIGNKEQYSNDKCYICNHPSYLDALECEHILPFETAITHITILQDKKSVFDDYLKKEYKWAHKCCNVIKNNIDVIKYTENGWEVDIDNIKTILNKIKSSESAGCTTIKQYGPVDTVDNVNNFIAIVEPLVDIINKNTLLIGENYYKLYLFYKLISTFDNSFLDTILVGKNPRNRRVQYGGNDENDILENIFNPNNNEFSKIISQEINETIDEFIENPELLKPNYIKTQRIIYDEDGNEVIINRFHPYDTYQELVLVAKNNNGIMPEFKPYKTYFIDDNNRSEFPTEGNPYGTFDTKIMKEYQQLKNGGSNKTKRNNKKMKKNRSKHITGKSNKNRSKKKPVGKKHKKTVKKRIIHRPKRKITSGI